MPKGGSRHVGAILVVKVVLNYVESSRLISKDSQLALRFYFHLYAVLEVKNAVLQPICRMTATALMLVSTNQIRKVCRVSICQAQDWVVLVCRAHRLGYAESLAHCHNGCMMLDMEPGSRTTAQLYFFYLPVRSADGALVGERVLREWRLFEKVELEAVPTKTAVRLTNSGATRTSLRRSLSCGCRFPVPSGRSFTLRQPCVPAEPHGCDANAMQDLEHLQPEGGTLTQDEC